MKKGILVFTLFIVGIYTHYAQLNAESIRDTLPLKTHNDVQAMRIDRTVPFESVKKSDLWKAYDSTITKSNDNAVWLRFKLQNTTSLSIKIYLKTNSHYTDIYIEDVGTTKHLKNGYLVSLNERDNKNESNFTELSILPGRTYTCYVKMANNYHFERSINPVLYSRLAYLENIYNTSKSEAKSIGFIYFYIIALSCIFIFVLVFWMRLQQRIYIYYLAYLFFQIIYGLLLLSTTSALVSNVFLHTPRLFRPIFEPVQFIFIGFYIFFILHLLEINKHHKTLSKVLYYFGLLCFVYAISYFILYAYFTNVDIGVSVFAMIRFIVLPLNFILIIWIIYKVKHPLINYFIFGQTLFFIGSVLSFYLAYTGSYLEPNSFLNFPYRLNIIFQIGLLGEVFCFSIAIGENIYLLQKDKNLTTKKLIEQLQENRVMQDNMNAELDKKVTEKTRELIKVYSKIEKQKEIDIKNKFKKRIQDMEILALRARMNPHFIFNSLNALKNLIMISNIDGAVDYLDNFSILLRSILQNSTKDVITVEEELEILELYLSLEKNRIGDTFEYTIQIPSREILSQYTIPPLLLQPFVENAIWHGLNPSEKKDKRLNIIFETTKNLKIIIEDNGIGRQASANFHKIHKSMGTDITRERLSLYNHTNGTNVHLTIIDLNEKGEPTGTRVIINFND